MSIKILTILTFFVPLIVLPDLFIFPFVVPKVIFFRSLAALLFGLFILLFFVNKAEFRPKFSVLHAFVGLYSLFLLISTFVGVDWYNSFWDSHERMLGTFTILHYVAYYFVLSSVFKKKEEWKGLLWWFVSAGSLVVGVGLLQRVDPNLLLNSESWRVIATLGNPIYLGGYGLFLAYMGYLLGMEEKKIAWRRNLAFFLSFLGLVGIVISGTRGTLLGLLVSLGVLCLIYIFYLREKEQKKVRILLSSMLVCGALVLSLFYIFRSTNFVIDNFPTLGRLVNSSVDADTGSTRIMAWKIAYESFQQYPIFGWGQNNFYYAFNQYYNPHFMFFGGGETWFDNAHNVVMNTLSTGGILGLLAYLGLFVLASYSLLRAYQKQMVSIHLFAVGVAFLVGHFIHNFFVFENATSFLYFFFFLAFIESSTRSMEKEKTQTLKDAKLAPVLRYGVLLVVLVFIYKTNINVARANNANLEAMRAISQGQMGVAFVRYEEAKSYGSPHIGDIRTDFVRMGAELVQRVIVANKIDDAAKLTFNKLYEEQKINHAFRPIDIRVHILLIQMSMLGQYIDQSKGYLDVADTKLVEALALSPKRQQLLYLLSTIKIQKGQYEQGVVLAQQAVDLDRQVGDSWVHLALAYTQTNQLDKVAGVFDEAIKNGAVFSPTAKDTVKTTFGVTLP